MEQYGTLNCWNAQTKQFDVLFGGHAFPYAHARLLEMGNREILKADGTHAGGMLGKSQNNRLLVLKHYLSGSSYFLTTVVQSCGFPGSPYN